MPPLPPGATARCVRCGAPLLERRAGSVERTLALCVAGLLLLLLTNTFPLLAVEMQGQRRETVLLTGVVTLFQEGWSAMATAVLLTCGVVPLAWLAGMVWLLLPLHLGRRPWGGAALFRRVRHLRPWGMLEVFVLGVLVSYVKLAHMATLVLGPGIFALGALMVVLAEATVSLDEREVWARLEPGP